MWNLHPNGRAIEKQNKISDLDVDKFAVRGLSKYLLITDISRFYGSIYTHSIPWALHTKDVAKKDRTDRLLENLLDKNARNGQDGQTVGVPIGPDTSLVIAEVILSAFDQMLRKEIKSIIGFRYVDDFEIGFKSYGEAEQALGIIRGLLREFELETNTEKTKIIELPEPVDAIWVGELRRHTIRTFSKSQKFDLTAFFDKAIHFSRIYPTEHVLNYAISVLSNKKIAKENWSLVESFLLQCIMAEGSVLFPALKFLQKADTEGHPIYRPHLQHVMNHIIEKKCTAGHMNEISWALWASLHWSLGISKEAANVLSSITDSVVVLMAIHAHNKGLMPSSFDITKWKPYVDNPDELYGS